MRFDGPGLERHDHERLRTLMDRVAHHVTASRRWWTLRELAVRTGGSEASVSARLRDLRKDKFRKVYGAWDVERRRVEGGLWEYRAVPLVLDANGQQRWF